MISIHDVAFYTGIALLAYAFWGVPGAGGALIAASVLVALIVAGDDE